MKFYYNFNHADMPLHRFYIFSAEYVFEAFKRVFPDYENHFLEIESDMLCNMRLINALSVRIILLKLGCNKTNVKPNSFLYYTHSDETIVKDCVVVKMW